MHLLSYSKTKNKHKYILPISGFSNFLFQYKCVNSVKDQGEEWKKRREEEKKEKQSLRIILFRIYVFFQKDISIFYFQIANIWSVLIWCNDSSIHCWNLFFFKKSLFKYKMCKDFFKIGIIYHLF